MDNDREAVETPRPVLTRDVMREYSLWYGFLALCLCLAGIAYSGQHHTLDEKSCIRIGWTLIKTSGTLSLSTVLLPFGHVLYALKYQPNRPEAEIRPIFASACRSLLYAVLAYLPSVVFLVVGAAKKGEMEDEVIRQLLEFVTLTRYAYLHWTKLGYTLKEYLDALSDEAI